MSYRKRIVPNSKPGQPSWSTNAISWTTLLDLKMALPAFTILTSKLGFSVGGLWSSCQKDVVHYSTLLFHSLWSSQSKLHALPSPDLTPNHALMLYRGTNQATGQLALSLYTKKPLWVMTLVAARGAAILTDSCTLITAVKSTFWTL